MIFNSVIYENTLPQGMGVLEIADPSEQKKRLFIPLTLTELSGTITGPLASFTLTQVFSYPSTAFNHPIEAIYRFPLPGDALITMAEVFFGNEVLKTSLQERDDAKDEYHRAFEQGRAALLLTREAADIFILHLTGIEPDRPVRVSIRLLQYGTEDDADMVFRLPLTTTPRYMRDDEWVLGRRKAEPLLMLLDPHHTFRLNVLVLGDQRISSPSHPITIQEEGDGLRVTLNEIEVIPDRDFVLTCHQVSDAVSPGLSCQVEKYPDEDAAFILATIHPPKESLSTRACRELIILVDHSGSMEGAKWEAADWAVTKLLKRLHPDDRFALGVFHTETAWFQSTMKSGTEENIATAIRFLKKNTESGGTELGKALEEGLSFPRVDGPYARHVIIITDAEVTDEGRLIRMIREEQTEEFPRRVSMLCIDAAPNTPLVQEMVRVGGGIARFLTSEPDEQDITTALEKTLAWWDTPIMDGLFLEINRDCVYLPDSDPLPGRIPLSSRLFSSHTLVLQVSLQGPPLRFRLVDAQGNELAVVSGVISEPSGIRAWFGSARIRLLEQIQEGFYKDSEVKKIVTGLGYGIKRGKRSLYPEKKRKTSVPLHEILVSESLRYGIPSTLTALVCASERAGLPVKATVVVPSASPYGWDDEIHSLYEEDFSDDRCGDQVDACIECCMGPPPDDQPHERRFYELDMRISEYLRESEAPSLQSRTECHPYKEIEVSFEQIPDGILFKGPLHGWGRLTGICIREKSMSAIPPDIRIEISLNAETTPRVRIALSDLLDGDMRPLNITLKKSDQIIIALRDDLHHLTTGTVRFRLVSD